MSRTIVAEWEDLRWMCTVCVCAHTVMYVYAVYLLQVLDKGCFVLTVTFCHGTPNLSLKTRQTYLNWWAFVRLAIIVTFIAYLLQSGSGPAASHVLFYLIQ